jgi:hypothetical protein
MKAIFRILQVLIFAMPFLNIKAQTSLTGGGLTQNFDAMAATTTLPTNWRFHRSASPTWAAGVATVGQQASSGSPATGSGYNWGSTAAERAVGVMSSGSFASPSSFMWNLTNGTGATISQMAVSYDVERYRINSAAASVQFFYSTDGTTWTAVTAGDVAAGSLPTGTSAYAFNPPNLTVNVGVFYITGLSIPNAANFYFRWNLNTTGANSQGIGIDNVVLSNTTPQALPYSQNFGTTVFSSFPNGFWGFRNVNGSTVAAQATAEATNPNMLATATSQSGAFVTEPSGGLFGQDISSNANLVIATSNSTTDGLNQPVTAINTGANTSITISYDQIVRFSGSRTMGIALQYRAGTSGSWTTVSSSPTSYAASPTLNSVISKSLSVTGLTASTDYQFRWITWRNHASGSTNTSIGLDNVSFSVPCTAPSTQASAIIFPSVGSITLDVNWTNGNGAGRVVKMNTSNSFTAPANGTNPTASLAWANSGEQVVFNGTGSGPISITGLTASTTYWFRVYEYCSPDRNYQTATATNNPNSQATTSGGTPSLSATTLTAFGTQCVGGTYGPNSFTITGTLLTSANVTVAASSGYTYSTTSGGTYTSTLSLSQSGGAYSQIIYVKFDPIAAVPYNANIVVGGGGASSINVTPSGTGSNGTPAITTVTASSVLTTTASSGGNTLSTTCGTITAKGVVWGTSANPTVPSANSTSDGTGTTSYTSSITGLTAGTTYNYRAYATNNSGVTSYGTNLTFTTLSLEPTAHAASFTVGSPSSTSLTLTFPAASTLTNAAGYIILQRAGAAATTGTPTDATGYSVGNTVGDGTVAAIISSTAATSTVVSGLSNSSQYTFSLIPFGYNGSDAASYNYRIAATIPTASGTTLSAPVTIVTFPSTWSGITATAPSVSQNANISGTVTVTRGSGLSAITSGARFNSDNFPTTGTLTLTGNTDYLTFTVTAGAGYTLDLNSAALNFSLGSSGTGPVNYGVYSSVGGFASTAAQIGADLTTASTSVSFPSTGYNGLSTIEIRIYGWGGSNSGGTGGFSSMNLTGNLVSVGTITTGTVSTSLCAGATGVSVPFTYTPAANFPNGTAIFQAQLSNSAGSFGTPVNLQTVTSNASGSQSISATIPSGTATGTGYRIRVVSTSPTVNGTEFLTNIAINNSGTSIAPSSTQNIFTSTNGTTLTVTENSTATSRQWKYGTASGGPYGTNLGTATTQIPNFASTGTFFIVCESTYGAPCSATITSNEVQIVVTTATPEINIEGNSTNIADGDVSPATADHTDFGGVLVSAGTIIRTFTIQNTGSANLNLTGAPLVAISGTHAADFSVTTVPTSPVAAAGSITFQVTFNPSAAGTRSASISIDNNDSDENPYNFNIQGTGLVPEIQLEQPIATNQACGFNYDYGSRLLSTNTDITVRVRNTGDGQLDGVGVVLSGLDASEFSFLSTPSSTINAVDFEDFTIRFTPTSGGSKVAVVTISSSDSDEGTCTINLYGEGDASPVIPTLTSPTVSAILNTSATIGATLTNDGNAAISARGTVWKTTSPVAASDNALAEGGTAVSTFTHSRTALPSGTRIYYRGYATNSAGTGLSPESNFFTLSNEPVGNAVTFTATAASATQINLSFSAASTIPASGYIILMKSGSAVTGTPTDATAYAVNDAIGDANVVGLITTATSFSVTGLSGSTNYHFALVPFSWNGSNTETRNYYISPLRAANATTNAATNPVLGDIAFVAYATDAPDRFAFVALADIAANAEIAFTDNAWSSGSALCTNEETVRWKAPATGLTKGNVVRIQDATVNVGSIVSGNLNNLSATADQIFAYTGTSASPSFIAGLSSTTLSGVCQTCGTSTNATCLPSPLVNGDNTISFASHSDNGYYSGETYGTVATLRSAINNPANWTRSNTTQTWPTPWSFTIGNVTITTGTITPTSYCVSNTLGTSISIPYTTGGAFETGNVFTAQLSDASGSFAIPTNIGTGLVSPIAATIPAGTVNGTGYRVRVVSSDPEADGLQNTTNLTVFLNTPDASTLSALRQNGGAIVNWTNPSGTVCWDQILVVAQPTNAFTALPTGDGTAYTANSTFGSGTAFGTGGSVVFKGTGAAVTISGFTNATTYYVKVFVRKGMQWSEGIEVSVVPSPDITGDFRSRVATGNWSDFASWERFNGTSWVNATSGQFPDNTTTTVTVQNGHTITVDGSSDPYDVKNIIVATGGKLYANLTASNRYLSVYGDITCNGTIGNGSIFDGLSFNIEGPKVTISGTGTFDASRIRKNFATNATSDVIIAMNVNLRWNSSSGTTIYNNTSSTRFNVIVNENSTLSLILASGGTSGNASIDGVSGSTGSTDRRGGTFTINGTMNIPGTLYATTDNDATGGYFCKWVIGTTGVINCRQLDCSASGAAGHTIEIKNGGKLNINNNNDNTVDPIVNFSTTNNTFTFADGGIVEYSSTDLTGSQKIFINAGFPYKNLLLSGPSTKQLQTAGTLNVGGDLTITGGVLDIQTNNIDLKGNWENYSQAGFIEGTQKVTFSGTGKQTIQCVGGEQFYNVDITNSSVAGVELNTDLTLSNDLDLLTNGKLVFGPTPQKLRLSKMTSGSNTFKGSGTATVDMSTAEHEFTIGCPDPGFTGTLIAGTTSTVIYNRDEDFAGSADDQNILTAFNYANLLFTGKGNKVVSDNITINSNFTAETPDLILSAPVAGKTLTLGGNFLLNSGATMNDNCRDNQDIVTTGNTSQVFNTNTKNLKAFNLRSTKTAGGISLTGGATDQTTLNLKNDFALNYTGTAVFTDNANTINVGDDAELGSGSSTASNFAFSGLMQFNGIGAATDIHLSDFAGTGNAKAELNNVIVRAGENATVDQLEVYPTAGGQSVTFKGNLEIIQGANSSEFDLNGNTLNLNGNWNSYDENAFNEGTTSTVVFNGTSAHTITVPSKEKFANLSWNNTNNLVMSSEIEVVTNLTVSNGKIQTGANKVTLGAAATITEDENHHVLGRVETTRTLTLANHTFGGLGLEIDANGSLPGVTVVNRYTGATITGSGNQGITRKFSIVPATNTALNAKLVFGYWDTEINGLDENNFQLFRSTDGGIVWSEQTAVADPILNTITKTAISSFSDWTAGDVNTPLPVSLISFSGKAGKGKADLFWNMASEKDNSGYKILRSADGQIYSQIGFIIGSGSSVFTQNYHLADNGFDQSYFYKLVQINQEGFEEMSKVIFLDCGCDNRLVISLYPNPTRGEVHFLSNQNLGGEEVFQLELLGMDGKLLYSNHAPIQRLESLLNERISGIAAGMYNIRLYNQRVQESWRLRRE